MKKLLLGVVAVWTAGAVAETLTVESGEARLETTDATYEAVVVRGALTVSGARLSLPDGTGENGKEKVVVSLGGKGADDVSTLTVKDGGTFGQTPGKGEILEVGANGGWGRLDVRSSDSDAFRMRYLDIAAAATPPADGSTVLTVGGAVNLRSLRNRSDKTVKVAFVEGGQLRATDSNDFVWFENEKATGSVILEGTAESPIYLSNMGQPRRTLSKGGSVRTTGTCDFIAYGFVTWQGEMSRLVISEPNVIWGHTGDIRLQESVEVSCDDALPVGEGRGVIRFDAVKDAVPMALDLKGCTNAVNAVWDMTGNSLVSNSSAKVLSVLRLGTAVDGAFTARAGGLLRLEQVGRTVQMSNAVVACSYALAGGTLRVTGDSSIDSLDVAEDAAVVVDGVTLTVGTLRDSGGTFSCVNGGRLALASGGTGTVASGTTGGLLNPNLAGVETFEKTGANTLVVHQTNAIPCNIHVAAGTLRLAGVGCTNEWWRWTVKEAGGWYVELASIGLFRPTADTSAGRPEPTLQVRPAPAGVAASALERDQSFVPATVTVTDDNNDSSSTATYAGTRYLFANTPNRQFRVTNPIPLAANPDSWIPVTFRIAPDCIVGFSQRMGWTSGDRVRRFPRVFTLETSADGQGWTTVLSVDNCLWDQSPAWYLGTTDKETRDNCPHPFPLGGYDAPGAAGLSAGVDVRVDAGATLDLANVAKEEARTLSSLTVDAAVGGGTIRGVVIAAMGTLDVRNVAARRDLYGTVWLSLPDAVDAENFANWTLRVDGQVLARQIVWRDGAVRILPPGCLFILK